MPRFYRARLGDLTRPREYSSCARGQANGRCPSATDQRSRHGGDSLGGGDGEGESVGDGVGESVGDGLGLGLALGAELGLGVGGDDGVRVGVAVARAVGVAVGIGVAPGGAWTGTSGGAEPSGGGLALDGSDGAEDPGESAGSVGGGVATAASFEVPGVPVADRT
jgi:hypothetical protein